MSNCTAVLTLTLTLMPVTVTVQLHSHYITSLYDAAAHNYTFPDFS